MQAEGIRKGDRMDVYDDRGKVVGGWTALSNAVAEGNTVCVDVRHHDGETETKHWAKGYQVPITWGAGPEPEHYVVNNGVRHDVPTPPGS